jgi:Tol biopolymer transport system component
MTTFDRIEPRLPELIDELASARVPDYFDDLLQATAQAPQRPAWSALERWLPMGEIARPLPFRTVPWRAIAIAATLIVLLTAGLLAYAGSHPPVPAPFGPARGGVIVYHGPDGVIYAVDPAAGVPKAIVTGDQPYAYPLPSRDGQRIFYDHTENGRSQLFVAGIDGSDAHPLPGTYEGFTWVEWSPDSRRVGIVSQVDGTQQLTILEADGSAARTVPLDREMLTFWWLADSRIVFTGAAEPGLVCRQDSQANRCGLFVMDSDGTGVRELRSESDFHGISTSVAPDGQSVLYERWSGEEHGRLHVVDIATGVDREVRMDNRAASGDESNNAELSPDGSKILFDRFQFGQDHYAVIPTAGGTAINLGPVWPQPRDGVGPEAHWSADGTSIIAFYPGTDASLDELWLLDATGNGQDRQLDLPVTYSPPQQRLAP